MMKNEYRSAMDRISLTDTQKTSLYHRVRRAANPEPKHWGRRFTLIAAAALSLVLAFTITLNNIPVEAAIVRPSFPTAAEAAASSADDGFLESLRTFSYRTVNSIDRGADGNTVYSPYATSVMLAVLAECTSGETQQELLDVLHAESAAALSKETGALYRMLYSDRSYYLCRPIQSVWIDPSVSYNKDVLERLSKNEYTHSYEVSFKEDRAAKAVSRWFGDNMRSERRVSYPFYRENRVMFASAFEFRSEWKEQFLKEQNYQGVFTGTMATGYATYMNKVAAAAPFLQTEEATSSVIQLNGGSRFVMILPREEDGLDKILSDGALLKDIVSGTLHADKTSVEFSIPKVSFDETINMRELLSGMGVTSVFDETKADFSALSPDDGVSVGQIASNSLMDLSEDRTFPEGTAAFGADSGAMRSLTLNRPFIAVVVSENEIPLTISVVENAIQTLE